jgi:hypothetical protein
MTGVQTLRSGNSAPLTAPADLLHCADGEIIVSAYREPHWRRFAQAIGAPELLTDRRFSSGMDRAGHRAELVSLIQRRALSRAGHKLSAVGSHEDALTERIERQVGVDGLLEVLAERLPPTDLQSLLLAAYRRRAAAVDPSRLLERYRADRFVAPAGVDPRSMAALEVSIFSLLPDGYEGVEISPLCPLGTNSAITSVDQNNVVTTIRNTEVVADVTNVLALECAVRVVTFSRVTPVAHPGSSSRRHTEWSGPSPSAILARTSTSGSWDWSRRDGTKGRSISRSRACSSSSRSSCGSSTRWAPGGLASQSLTWRTGAGRPPCRRASWPLWPPASLKSAVGWTLLGQRVVGTT